MKKVSLLYWRSQFQVFLTIDKISAFPSALGGLYQGFHPIFFLYFPILHKLISGGFILAVINAMVCYIVIKSKNKKKKNP